MANLIVTAAVVLIVGAAAAHIIKEKKRGTVCIGCPSAGTCSRHCSGCHTDDTLEH